MSIYIYIHIYIYIYIYIYIHYIYILNLLLNKFDQRHWQFWEIPLSQNLHIFFDSFFCKGPCIYDVHTEGRRGILESVFWILLFLNNKSIVYFWGWWGVGGSKNRSFFVDVINGWLFIVRVSLRQNTQLWAPLKSLNFQAC